MHPKGLQVSLPSDTVLVMTRTFNAPRRLVWEAFTNAERMRRWMLPPPGFTITTLVCEARVGGALKIAWKNAEADPAMTLEGVFTDVVPQEKMVHTEEMKLGTGQVIGNQLETHAFAEAGGVTTMTITQVFDSKEARDCTLQGQEEGCEAGFKQLDALLAQSA